MKTIIKSISMVKNITVKLTIVLCLYYFSGKSLNESSLPNKMKILIAFKQQLLHCDILKNDLLDSYILMLNVIN